MPEGSASHGGQHFLARDALARELVRAAQVCRSDLVVDLGAGDGRLTRALLSTARHVVAVENDIRLVGLLRRRYAGRDDVSVVGCDIRRFRWPTEPFRVVANPPFGLTTYLLRELLGDPRLAVTGVDLVVQHGAAIKRTRPCGHALNVSWLPWWTLRIDRRIPASAFRPPPRVGAAVIRARRRDPSLLPERDADAFRRFVAAGFRRGLGREATVDDWVRAFQRDRPTGSGRRRR